MLDRDKKLISTTSLIITMDSKSIGKTFLNLVYWIVGIIAVALLAALGISKILDVTFQTIVIWFALILVGLFVLAVLINMIQDYVKKEIYKVLEEEKLIKQKRLKNEQNRF